MNALQFLNSLRPALPLSRETPPTKERPATLMSNAELRRLIQQSGVLINSESVTLTELIDFPVFSIVFYPKSDRHRTTIL